jgi:hypothetical protein
VYAAGQAHWQDPVAALLAVGHYGTYDYQRDEGVFYSAYTDASNYAVGLYMAGRVTPMMQLSPSPASSQTCIPLTLAPKGRGLGGQEVGMTRQTVPDHFQVHRRNEVDPAVNRIRQSPWLSRALIAVNVPGIAIFLFFASWVWAPPGQEGLYYDAGDSIGWTLLAFPFLAICTLFNFIASRSVLIRLFYHRDWMPFLLACNCRRMVAITHPLAMSVDL